ncbi:MAG: hypothetical protein KDE27_11195 [Planctomycetes bacterium]|nr:hypothetical protein [Planctomycetota bacterium]
MSKSICLSTVLSAAVLTALSLPAQCPAGGYQTGTSTGGSGGGGVGTSNPSPSAPSPNGPTTPNPTGPTTPGPSGPTTGGPTYGGGSPAAPTTGGPAAPPGAAVAARTGARGAAMTFERGRTSKDRLKLDWEHPVPPERGDRTSAAGALPLAEALALLWGDDQRPLLVLRECTACQGTDLPLLQRSMNNDRTQLLASWFRIVKLPPHVMEPSHPFHNVFAGQSFEGGMPHFYLLSHPGAEPVAFSGQPTQTYLLAAMTKIVEERYQLDPKRAVKNWLALLDQFDNIDATQKRVREQLREARADKGPKSSRAKSLQAQLDDLEMDRTKLLAKERKVRNIVLVPFPKSDKKIAAAK